MTKIRLLSSAKKTFVEEAQWYAYASVEHFWFEWRLERTLRLLSRASLSCDAPMRCLDIGGGTGVFRAQIESRTSWTVDVVDLNPSALRQIAPGRGEVLLYDIGDRQREFKDCYDLAFLLDVLEHLTEPALMVDDVLWHLKPGGHLVVNVPALNIFYSDFDRAVGHLRRYRKRSLRGEMAQVAAIDIKTTEYWGLMLLPALIARAWLRKGPANRAQLIRQGIMPPNKIAEWFLRALMHIELRWPGPIPFGSSLILLGQKING